MSIPKFPEPVKLITSIIYQNTQYRDEALVYLKKKWGDVDHMEWALPFDYTDYYRGEMGTPLSRSFLSFKSLIDRQQLVEAKLYSNQIEITLAKERGARTINIDPGYLTESQVVLATGKNYSHRIYLKEGIFADLTLIYEHQGFRALSWTYPDYQSKPLVGALLHIRKKYTEDKKDYESQGKIKKN